MVEAAQDAVETAKAEGRKPTAKDYRRAAEVQRNGKGEPEPGNDFETPQKASATVVPTCYHVIVRLIDDSHVAYVTRILKEAEIQFVQRKSEKTTSLVSKPHPENLRSLLINLATWLNSNLPSGVVIEVKG